MEQNVDMDTRVRRANMSEPKAQGGYFHACRSGDDPDAIEYHFKDYQQANQFLIDKQTQGLRQSSFMIDNKRPDVVIQSFHVTKIARIQSETVVFSSEGLECHGRLQLPDSNSDRKYPCIIMAHGFGLTMDSSLSVFADRFVKDGFAVMMFDYRHYGLSDGKPRQILDPDKQVQDWDAALNFIQSRNEIDLDRVGLWGYSFSGGHVVKVAAQDDRVRAVSSMCPLINGFMALLKAVFHGPLLFLPYVALKLIAGASVRVVAPNRMAALSSKDAWSGINGIKGKTFENAVNATIACAMAKYRVGKQAKMLKCPILYQLAENDLVVPLFPIRRAFKHAPVSSDIKSYNAGHFDMFTGEIFERAYSDQLGFFKERL